MKVERNLSRLRPSNYARGRTVRGLEELEYQLQMGASPRRYARIFEIRCESQIIHQVIERPHRFVPELRDLACESADSLAMNWKRAVHVRQAVDSLHQ